MKLALDTGEGKSVRGVSVVRVAQGANGQSTVGRVGDSLAARVLLEGVLADEADEGRNARRRKGRSAGAVGQRPNREVAWYLSS